MSGLGWIITGFARPSAGDVPLAATTEVWPAEDGTIDAIQSLDAAGIAASSIGSTGAIIHVLDAFLLSTKSIDVVEVLWPEFSTNVLRNKLPEVLGKTAAEADLHNCSGWDDAASVRLALTSAEIVFGFNGDIGGVEDMGGASPRCGSTVSLNEYEDICTQVLDSVAEAKLLAAHAVYMCAADCAFQAGVAGITNVVIAITLSWAQAWVAGVDPEPHPGSRLALAVEADPLSVRWRDQIGKSFHVQPSEHAIASGIVSENFASATAFQSFTSAVTASDACPDAAKYLAPKVVETTVAPTITATTAPEHKDSDPSLNNKGSKMPEWLYWLLVGTIAMVLGIILLVCVIICRHRKVRKNHMHTRSRLLEREDDILQQCLETRLTSLP